jgi:hypothetical protein
MANKKPFIYNYKQHKNNSLTVDQLDKIAAVITNAGGGYINNIIAAIKLLLILAWVISRKLMIEHEMLIAKQVYEQERNEDNQGQVDEDLT